VRKVCLKKDSGIIRIRKVHSKAIGPAPQFYGIRAYPTFYEAV